MPTSRFVIIIVSVMLAALLTVGAAASLPGFSYGWMAAPIAIALLLRLWFSRKPRT